MEKPAGQLDSNPNMCVACAEWDDATELLDHNSEGVIEISQSESIPTSGNPKRLPRAA